MAGLPGRQVLADGAGGERLNCHRARLIRETLKQAHRRSAATVPARCSPARQPQRHRSRSRRAAGRERWIPLVTNAPAPDMASRSSPAENALLLSQAPCRPQPRAATDARTAPSVIAPQRHRMRLRRRPALQRGKTSDALGSPEQGRRRGSAPLLFQHPYSARTGSSRDARPRTSQETGTRGPTARDTSVSGSCSRGGTAVPTHPRRRADPRHSSSLTGSANPREHTGWPRHPRATRRRGDGVPSGRQRPDHRGVRGFGLARGSADRACTPRQPEWWATVAARARMCGPERRDGVRMGLGIGASSGARRVRAGPRVRRVAIA